MSSSRQRVVDLGCGPGALMHLLLEIGVDADGIDYNEMSLKLATPEVRERIAIGDATDASIKADGSYDLVICREVLEHLTVLEVKKAVANMVRLTSRFIYVTTRFHPNPPTCSTSTPATIWIPRTSPCSTRTCCG